MGKIISIIIGEDDDDDDYEILDETQDVFEDITLGTRNYDCIMVFDIGRDVDWTPVDGAEKLHYEYVNLLDDNDAKYRNQRFVANIANSSHQTMPTEREFYKLERKLLVKALKKQQIKITRIVDMGVDFETEKNCVFYFVGVRENVARKFAHQIGHELELNPRAAIQYLNLQDDPLATATVSDDEHSTACVEDYWKNVFVKYNRHVAPEVFKTHDLLDEGDSEQGFECSIFSIRDRCYLINEIVNRDIEHHGGGCYVPSLIKKDHPLIDFFPIHTVEHLDDIMNDLFSYEGITELPLDKFKAYFGEYIALYFGYLQYFTWFLMPAAVIGFWFAIYQFIEGKVIVTGISYFAIAVILWAVMFPLLWRNLEYWYAARWGTLTFDVKEATRIRPEFEGIFIRSQVTGELYEYPPPGQRTIRQLLTLGCFLAFILGLAGSLLGVILLRVWVSNSELSFADYGVAVANALIIIFFNSIYGLVAERMNEWENYKTETEYENALIFKVFIFRFINSYATLYYIAFLRPLESESSGLYCDAETCMSALRIQLAVVFIVQLLVSNSIELGSLFATSWFRGGAPSFKVEDIQNKVWNEYSAAQYERTFDDYCELIISFGYCSLFCIAFPLAPLFGLVAAFVEAKIDGYKLCRLTRRPFPRQADDVGTWQFSMEFMGYATLVTNLLLVCFVTEDLDFTFLGIEVEAFEELITAAIMFFLLSIVIRIANMLATSKPTKILMHEQRQDHIGEAIRVVGNRVSKKFHQMREEEIKNWQDWTFEELRSYLRDVLFFNNDEFNRYTSILQQYNFNGSRFAKAEDHTYQDMGLTDYYLNLFLLNCRKMLENKLIEISADDDVFREIKNERRFGGRKKTSGKDNNGRGDLFNDADFSEEENGSGRPRFDSDAELPFESGKFRFTLDHFLPMAEFYDSEFSGASKTKLFQRVDKNSSQIIEKWELHAFLYYAIAIYIKSRFKSATLAGIDDIDFKRHTIKPLQDWLLENKIADTIGLSFDDFDRYFSTWLKQYYREKSDEIQISVIGGGNNDSTQNDNPHLLRSYRKGHIGSVANKQEGSGGKGGAVKMGDDTMQSIGYQISKISGQTIANKKSKLAPRVERSKWTEESTEWMLKLKLIADTAARTPAQTRERLFDRLDKKKKGRVNTDRQLMSLVYTFFALYSKSKDRNADAPAIKDLEPLLIDICYEMRPMLNGNNELYMDKSDFVKNIDLYLHSIAETLLSN